MECLVPVAARPVLNGPPFSTDPEVPVAAPGTKGAIYPVLMLSFIRVRSWWCLLIIFCSGFQQGLKGFPNWDQSHFV